MCFFAKPSPGSRVWGLGFKEGRPAKKPARPPLPNRQALQRNTRLHRPPLPDNCASVFFVIIFGVESPTPPPPTCPPANLPGHRPACPQHGIIENQSFLTRQFVGRQALCKALPSSAKPSWTPPKAKQRGPGVGDGDVTFDPTLDDFVSFGSLV